MFTINSSINPASNLASFLLKKKKSSSSWSLQTTKLTTNHTDSSSILSDDVLPPSYDDKSHPWAFQFPKSMLDRVIEPREEEGFEILPNYECTLEKLAPVFIKCEMTEPGIRSTSRAWKFLYLNVSGTLLQAYKKNPRHQTSEPVWSYSMQGAQVTVATDYVKHSHVLRLRVANGPQFLIKSNTDMDKLNWMNSIESSINISSDLDCRNMPQFITLPHRRQQHRQSPTEEALV